MLTMTSPPKRPTSSQPAAATRPPPRSASKPTIVRATSLGSSAGTVRRTSMARSPDAGPPSPAWLAEVRDTAPARAGARAPAFLTTFLGGKKE
jgi:hypothetical protein